MRARRLGMMAGLAGLALAAAFGLYLWLGGWLRSEPGFAARRHVGPGAPSASWSAVLRERYPPGSDPAFVAADLAHEAFKVDAKTRTASYFWGRFPCDYTLTARWRLDAGGKLGEIEGDYVDGCA